MTAVGRRVMYRQGGQGPVHLMQKYPMYLTWCGARPQFRHTVRESETAEITCRTCLRRVVIGRPLARGAKR